MNRLHARIGITFLVTVLAGFRCLADERHETADFQRIHDRVEQIVDKWGAKNVLFVVDIDNTLLAMNQDLGSDQWFNWQNTLLKRDPTSPDLVAKDFAGLLDAQRTLFALSKMHPPEPQLPALVAIVQARCTTIVLTSRGGDLRNSAMRALASNKYDFTKSALELNGQARNKFLPYDPKTPDRHGLTAAEVESLGTPRPVSYSCGVFMVAGQHKGYMLRTLLARTTRRFKAICFVDDHKKHTDRMQNAFEGREIEITTFRYSREDGNVHKFESSDKRHVVRKWQQLQRVVRRTFAN